MPEVTITIRTSGEIVFVHRDDLKELYTEGQAKIKRASHVEPWPMKDLDGVEHPMWMADLSPVNGPFIGPFPTRQEAVDAEVKWLEEHF